MLKKEFSDAIKRMLECLLILIVIPLALVLDKYIFDINWDFFDVFKVVYITIVILFSAYSGMTIFQSERKDRAFEYLFSLPLPRWKIIVYKISTRLLLLILLISISVFFSIFDNIFLAGFKFIFLFLVSVFISISVNSMILGIIGSGIIYLFYTILNRAIYIFIFGKNASLVKPPPITFYHQLISVMLILIPLGIAFWFTFKKLDIKPLKLQLKTYIAIVLPSFLILTSFIVWNFIKDSRWFMEL